MKKIYIVRHGQTDWNKELRRQGRKDIELNKKGEEQAHEIKEKFKNINFDICYTSPLKRARKTAEIIIDGRCEIITENLIIEQSFGKLEGKVIDKTETYKKYWQLGLKHDDKAYESLEDMLKRAENFIEKIKECDAENILVVSHGCFLKALHYNIVGYDKNTDLTDWFLENCSFDIYEI